MRNPLATALLIASALFTGWTSWTSFRAPAQFARQLGYVVAGVDGRNEIRAQYGGFFLAVAVAGVLTLAGVIPRQAGLLVNAVVFGGLIAGRMTSCAIDGPFGGYGLVIRGLFFIDSIFFIASITGLCLDRLSAG